MSLRNRLKRQLRNREFRHAYADEHLNLSISTQIKAIREKQRMSQSTLGAKIGTQQAGVSRIESANYDRWSIGTLRSLAEAFDLRLRVSFEEFGSLWKEVDTFSRQSMERRRFDEDPEFSREEVTALPTLPACNMPEIVSSQQQAATIEGIGWPGNVISISTGRLGLGTLDQRPVQSDVYSHQASACRVAASVGLSR